MAAPQSAARPWAAGFARALVIILIAGLSRRLSAALGRVQDQQFA